MIFWCLALLPLAAPAGPLTPASVTEVTVAFTSSFEPDQGLAGLTLPTTGVGLATDGESTCLRLEPQRRRAADVWIQLPPEALGKRLRVSFRARHEGFDTPLADGAEPPAEMVIIELAPVLGSRPPASAPAWAQQRVEVGRDWSEYQLSGWMAPPSDLLAVRAPAAAAPVRLDDVKVEVLTTIRDERIAELARRSGNLIANGGFEFGEVGFRAVYVHDAIDLDDPPLPGAIRASDRDAAEGSHAAFAMVGASKLILTPDTVVLLPERTYTLSLLARGLSRTNARLTLGLVGPDGREVGVTEAALSFEWRRVSTSIKVPSGVPQPWTPRICALSGDEPYAVQFDAICLAEGESTEYAIPQIPVLELRDGLGSLGPGHLASPDEPFTLTAVYHGVGDAAEAITVRASAESHLGRRRLELPAAELQVEPGVRAEVPLWSEPLPAGWYRFTVTAGRGDEVIARDELIVASLPAIEDDLAWRLAVEWTTPDSLLPGPFLGLVLEPLRRLGVTTRWLERNATALWRGHEPQPGNLQVSALMATLAGGEAAGLETVFELDPFPARWQAPDWLQRTAATTADGRLIPPADAWQRYVAGLARNLVTARPTIAVGEAPPGLEAERAERLALAVAALKAVDESWSLVGAVAEEWQRLPAPVSGPIETDLVEPGQGFEPIDPMSAEAARALALARGLAAGRQRFRLPDQGWQPAGNGRFRHGGITTADGGPRPFVAVWATVRHVLGDRRLVRCAGAEGGRRLAVFSDGAALLWNEGAPAEATLLLEPAAKLRLATGESLERDEAGSLSLTLEAFPVLADGLSESDIAALEALISAP